MTVEGDLPTQDIDRTGDADQGAVGPQTLRALWRNSLTVGGGILCVLSILFMLGFFIVDMASAQPSPYIGLFTFLVFPSSFAIGAIGVVVGLVVARRRFRREFGNITLYQYYPHIDLSNVSHRRYVVGGAGAIALAIPVVGVLSYQGYHYTDSNQFCGTVCHTVMQPQFAAYQQSPHAHVACAECHIGAGASWYVKSKLSGIRQVFAVALNSFPRPIPPAIQELRPATETCRECHWPSKFFGDQLVTIEHFAADEANTHQQLRMLLKTGGSDPSTGPPSGIHWHMALGFEIEYVAVDKHLQDIPWVKMTDRSTGRQAVYRSDGRRHDEPPPSGTHRTVDCMDCHNRPTHIFRSPNRAVDEALNANSLLQSLPFAKRETVAALSTPYPTKDTGLAAITSRLAGFYERSYPQTWTQRKGDVDRLVLTAREIYSTNFFPEMNVSWRTYPDNIGHKIYAGCFRCHEGRHIDESGRAISHECGTCHEFLSPARQDENAVQMVGIGGFVHPIELEGSHSTMRCDKCHTGGIAPERTCAGCHSLQAEFRAGKVPAFQSFKLAPDAMAEAVDCEGCHDLSRPTTVEVIDEKCMDCHSDDEDRYKGMLPSWKTELDAMLLEAESLRDDETVETLRTLRKAGPLHNVEAARTIARALGAGAGSAKKVDE